MDRVALLTEREIYKIVFPTIGIFIPLLEVHRAEISQTPKRTFAYGSDARHKLDVYYPSRVSDKPSKVLVFVYGGGLTSGSRNLPPPAELAYGNLGTYFSQRGFVTVIPDYRLSPDVKYPVAAQDVRDAIEWIVDHPENLSFAGGTADVESLYVMGHSAGCVNVVTALLSPEVHSPSLQSKIKGVVLFSGAHVHDSAEVNTWQPDVVRDYYGGAEEIQKKLPLGLLQNASDEMVRALPRILVGTAEWDPSSFLAASNILSDALAVRSVSHEHFVAKGHNHISVNFALGAGEGDEWAREVIDWIENA